LKKEGSCKAVLKLKSGRWSNIHKMKKKSATI